MSSSLGCHADVVEVADCCKILTVDKQQKDKGLVVFCLHRLKVAKVVPSQPIKSKAFQWHRASSMIIQEVTVIMTKMWAMSVGFVALIPVLKSHRLHS